MTALTELQKLFRKYNITARKYEGDDTYSWAVFHKGQPVVSGLSRPEVAYYKNQVLQSLKIKERWRKED